MFPSASAIEIRLTLPSRTIRWMARSISARADHSMRSPEAASGAFFSLAPEWRLNR